jgi:hypothetical protein
VGATGKRDRERAYIRDSMIKLFMYGIMYDVIAKHKFGSEPAIPVSPCIGRLEIKEWLVRLVSKQSEHWVATRVLTKLFIEGTSEVRDLPALSRK